MAAQNDGKLATAVQGALRNGQDITWLRDDGTPEDLTGATITATYTNKDAPNPVALAGTFSITDGPNGIFHWDYVVSDVTAAGLFHVEFSAAFGSGPTPAKTFLADWTVTESLT